MVSVTGEKTPKTFTQKKINVTFTVPNGAIGPGSDADTVTLTGHRCQVNVTNGGMTQGTQASLRIEGMTLAMMNRLTMVRALAIDSNPYNGRINSSVVTIQAGDDISGMSTVFIGTVSEAFVDFSASPNVSFQVTAWSTIELKVQVATPTSFKGSVSAATVLSEICAKASYSFINHGVTKTLSNFYGWGSIDKQIKDVVNSLNLFYHINEITKTVDVWQNNPDTSSATNTIKISKHTGLIGYPQYNQLGVSLTTIFNPQIAYNVPIYLESEYLPEGWVNNQSNQKPGQFPTTGFWNPFLIQHDLVSEMPGGPWFTHIEAQRAELPKTQVSS